MRQTAAMLLGFLATGSLGQAGEPITIGETLTLPSKVLGEEREVLVSTPPGYARSSLRYPVLYLADGDVHLGHARGTADYLGRAGLLPDLIIVGVGNTDRDRDLSPTRTAPAARGGGAARFLDFFAQELLPFVEQRYRTAPYRILAGHSLGGLFTLEALASRPELWGAVIAASPVLDWEDDYILKRLAEALGKGGELKRTLFVSMANEEASDPAPTRFDRLRTTLSSCKRPGFVWEGQVLAGETHGTVALRTFDRGLRKVFEGWPLPRDPQTQQFRGDLADLKKHFAALKERFGYEVTPPEMEVARAGYQRLSRNDLEGALAFLGYNAEAYPDSAYAHAALGEALEKSGRLEDALRSQESAVAAATRSGHPGLARLVARRDRLAKETAAARP